MKRIMACILCLVMVLSLVGCDVKTRDDVEGGGSGGSTGGGLGTLSSTTGKNGVFTFIGKGWGHNVGMSQWGAYAMAKQGYTYLNILQFYYTGITVGYM